ncbi:hypothetical protein [Moraxella catarrhalis]|uniref:hypothetical protein n=1 Tax=Moraxella catarrhalis TaxID=480 RepID=UPI00128E79AD|nr:hypothetical protein [Moraxella catarrhalis]MPX16906.1 hypothetical protein [Moraxella catarrhalis]MPY08995.1 hypothetical protein [Moraxella catarrhalis]
MKSNNFDNANYQELEKAKIMVDIAKMINDMELDRKKFESQMELDKQKFEHQMELDRKKSEMDSKKMDVEIEKLRKQTNYYPWVAIIISLIGFFGYILK